MTGSACTIVSRWRVTRNRAVATVPGPLNTEYYAERADAAILVSEGTSPAAVGHGYHDIPGLHTDEQQAGWAEVAAAVHGAGDARFVIQLMHCGRVAHPVFTDGVQPVAPSAVQAPGQVWTPGGMEDFVTPRAFTTGELAEVREQYVAAAGRAVAAGADGVELHAANGYLLHQFLSENTNQRTDGYGTDVAAGSASSSRRSRPSPPLSAPGTSACVSRPATSSTGSRRRPEATYDALLEAIAPIDLITCTSWRHAPTPGTPRSRRPAGATRAP